MILLVVEIRSMIILIREHFTIAKIVPQNTTASNPKCKKTSRKQAKSIEMKRDY